MPGKFLCRKNGEKISFPKNVRFSHRKNGGEISSKFEKVVLNACDGGILGTSTRGNFEFLKKSRNLNAEKGKGVTHSVTCA